ncbi:MAG: hypothetical protein ACREMA_10100, partial [Longimicrobiales bacterium]
MLRAAARRVAGTSAPDERDFTVELHAVTRCLEVSGQEALAALQPFEPSSCLTCLDRLRVEVIRGWSSDQIQVSAGEIIT